MSQKLTLPFNHLVMSAGYLNTWYEVGWGYPHYGVDCGEDLIKDGYNIQALGNGVVHSCGLDGYTTKQRLGYCTVIVYPDVLCADGKIRDIACRMFHQQKIFCKSGDKIKRGDIIGLYGNTGNPTSTGGTHLHIEFDTDAQYPQYAVGISGSGRIIKLASSPLYTTIDPAQVWCIGDGQTIRGCDTTIKGKKYSCYSVRDINIRHIVGNVTTNIKPKVCPTCQQEIKK